MRPCAPAAPLASHGLRLPGPLPTEEADDDVSVLGGRGLGERRVLGEVQRPDLRDEGPGAHHVVQIRGPEALPGATQGSSVAVRAGDERKLAVHAA